MDNIMAFGRDPSENATASAPGSFDFDDEAIPPSVSAAQPQRSPRRERAEGGGDVDGERGDGDDEGGDDEGERGGDDEERDKDDEGRVDAHHVVEPLAITSNNAKTAVTGKRNATEAASKFTFVGISGMPLT